MRRPVYDTIHLPVSYELAVGHLRGPADTWLPPPARRHEEGVVVTMRAAGLLSAAGVDALVHVDDATMDSPSLHVRPIAWRALTADRAFPRLRGDLELEWVNDSSCRLTLVGGYQPPISVVGDTADRFIGHHIADAVVRMFLEGVAGVLTGPGVPPTLRV